MTYLLVGIGGFLGAVSRYAVGIWVGHYWGRSFPLGTFLINISGSFLIGLLMPVLTARFLENQHWRLIFVVGFLGAYTTFSAFEYETGALIRDGEWTVALLYVVLSVVAGFGALRLGEFLAKLA